jgi:NDP-sugar pyrophosphorylase family protein
MVEVAGRPFLEHIVRHLIAQHFDRFLLLVGYLGEQVEDYFGNGARFKASIHYAKEPQPLGTAGAIKNALTQLEPEFLLLYGDSYLPIDYREVIQKHRACKLRALMVVYDNSLQDTGVINNVAISPNQTVARYQKGQAAPDLRYVEAGVLCFNRDVFASLPPSRAISMEHVVYPALIAAGQLGAFVTRQRFFDIGTPSRLEEFAAATL